MSRYVELVYKAAKLLYVNGADMTEFIESQHWYKISVIEMTLECVGEDYDSSKLEAISAELEAEYAPRLPRKLSE